MDGRKLKNLQGGKIIVIKKISSLIMVCMLVIGTLFVPLRTYANVVLNATTTAPESSAITAKVGSTVSTITTNAYPLTGNIDYGKAPQGTLVKCVGTDGKTYVFVANFTNGIDVFDTTDYTKVSTITPPTGYSIYNLVMAGNYLYAKGVNGTTCKLLAYDVTNPLSLNMLGAGSDGIVAGLTTNYTEAVVCGNVLAFAAGTEGVKFFDITSKESPSPITTSFSTATTNVGKTIQLATDGHYIYGVASASANVLSVYHPYFDAGTNKMQVELISQLSGSYTYPGDSAATDIYAHSIVLYGDYAAIWNKTNYNIQIIDTSDPANLKRVKKLDLPSPSKGVYSDFINLAGDILYVGYGNGTSGTNCGKIYYMDFSDPENCVFDTGKNFDIISDTTGDYGQANCFLDVDGQVAIWCRGIGGLFVYDIAIAKSCRITSSSTISSFPANITGVAVGFDSVEVTDGENTQNVTVTDGVWNYPLSSSRSEGSYTITVTPKNGGIEDTTLQQSFTFNVKAESVSAPDVSVDNLSVASWNSLSTSINVSAEATKDVSMTKYATLIAALYKNDQLVKVAYCPKEELNVQGVSEPLSVSVDISNLTQQERSQCYVRAYVWDDINNMVPLCSQFVNSIPAN